MPASAAARGGFQRQAIPYLFCGRPDDAAVSFAVLIKALRFALLCVDMVPVAARQA
jgi:hypothetical protein